MSQDSLDIETLAHVGVGVSDIPEALHFHTGILGLKEAFRMNRADGSPSFIYLQVDSGSTFVELKHEIKEWFNLAAFAQPAIGTLGNLGTDVLRGPGAAT